MQGDDTGPKGSIYSDSGTISAYTVADPGLKK